MKDPIDSAEVEALLARAYAEDLAGPDLTTAALVPEDAPGRAAIRAKADGVIAGGFMARAAFGRQGAEYEAVVPDGGRVAAGTVVGRIRGPLAGILRAERTALNFLGRLSGVATLTAKFVEAVKGTKARILDTRKTTPGWRALERHAVRMGGGESHRASLSDQALLKSNHVAAARAAGRATGFAGALKLLAEGVPAGVRIGVEVRNLAELHLALEIRPAYVLCDNFAISDLALAVKIRDGWPGEPRPLIEASGGVRLDTAAEIAATGVDRISVGALTHSAPVLDLSLGIDA